MGFSDLRQLSHGINPAIKAELSIKPRRKSRAILRSLAGGTTSKRTLLILLAFMTVVIASALAFKQVGSSDQNLTEPVKGEEVAVLTSAPKQIFGGKECPVLGHHCTRVDVEEAANDAADLASALKWDRFHSTSPRRYATPFRSVRALVGTAL